jgi:hypothetical protein
MTASLLADLVVVLHLAFAIFAVAGGLLAVRWPRAAWIHLPAAAWGAFIELSGRICPLTPLEQHLRRAAGQAGYEGDFVAHYVLPVLYPAGLTRGAQIVLAAALLAVNVVIYAVVWRRHGSRRPRPGSVRR